VQGGGWAPRRKTKDGRNGSVIGRENVTVALGVRLTRNGFPDTKTNEGCVILFLGGWPALILRRGQTAKGSTDNSEVRGRFHLGRGLLLDHSK